MLQLLPSGASNGYSAGSLFVVSNSKIATVSQFRKPKKTSSFHPALIKNAKLKMIANPKRQANSFPNLIAISIYPMR
jgi:hypothetical protein